MAGYPSVADLKDFARSEIPTADDSLYTTALSADGRPGNRNYPGVHPIVGNLGRGR